MMQLVVRCLYSDMTLNEQLQMQTVAGVSHWCLCTTSRIAVRCNFLKYLTILDKVLAKPKDKFPSTYMLCVFLEFWHLFKSCKQKFCLYVNRVKCCSDHYEQIFYLQECLRGHCKAMKVREEFSFVEASPVNGRSSSLSVQHFMPSLVLNHSDNKTNFKNIIVGFFTIDRFGNCATSQRNVFNV